MVGSALTRRNIQEPKKGDSAMNRHQRRRRAVMDKHNSFVRDYVHHLPEAGPDVLGKHQAPPPTRSRVALCR